MNLSQVSQLSQELHNLPQFYELARKVQTEIFKVLGENLSKDPLLASSLLNVILDAKSDTKSDTKSDESKDPEDQSYSNLDRLYQLAKEEALEEINNRILTGRRLLLKNGAIAYVDRYNDEPDHRGVMYFGVVEQKTALGQWYYKQLAWDQLMNHTNGKTRNPNYDIDFDFYVESKLLELQDREGLDNDDYDDYDDYDGYDQSEQGC